MADISEWRPTQMFRMFSPDSRYVPPVLQQRFECKTADGISGHVWASPMKAYQLSQANKENTQ